MAIIWDNNFQRKETKAPPAQEKVQEVKVEEKQEPKKAESGPFPSKGND